MSGLLNGTMCDAAQESQRVPVRRQTLSLAMRAVRKLFWLTEERDEWLTVLSDTLPEGGLPRVLDSGPLAKLQASSGASVRRGGAGATKL